MVISWDLASLKILDKSLSCSDSLLTLFYEDYFLSLAFVVNQEVNYFQPSVFLTAGT
jgi:hypothetical protein